MPYTPNDMSQRVLEQRPFGDAAAELAATRERRQAAQTTATAEPRGAAPANGGGAEPGYMTTPPVAEPIPELSSAGAPTADLTREARAAPDQDDWLSRFADPAPPPEKTWPPDITPRERARRRFGASVFPDRPNVFEEIGQAVLNRLGEVKDAAGDVLAHPQPTRKELLTGKTTPEQQERGGRVAGAALGVASLPYSLATAPIIEAQVVTDPFLSDKFQEAVSQLPPHQRNDPLARSEVAHQLIDYEAATLMRMVDDPSLNDTQRNAAFAGASLLTLERIAEFGGPQVLASLERAGIKVSASVAAHARSAAVDALRPRTLAYALDDAQRARAEALAAKLRAAGMDVEADALATEIAPVEVGERTPTESLAKITYDKRVAESKAAGTYDPENKAVGEAFAEPQDAARKPAGGAAALRTGPGGVTPPGTPTSAEGGSARGIRPRREGAPLQMPEPARTPSEGAPRGALIQYPTEENLGIPKNLMDSLPDNLKAVLVDEARRDYDGIQQARGGTIHDAQIDRESQQIMVDAGILAQANPRTPVTAPGMRALVRAARRIAEERVAIEQEAEHAGPVSVTDDMRARFAVKVFEQDSIQRVIGGARAEWGRVGQEFQKAVESGDRVRINNTYQSIIRAVGKDNIDAVMKRLTDIRNDPRLVGDPYAREVKAFKYVSGLRDATNWQKLDEVFFNALLSIPHTHMGIIVGQMFLAEAEALAKLIAGVPDIPLRALTLGRLGGPRSFPKAVAQFMGTQYGIATGLRAAKVFALTGVKRDALVQFVETGSFARGRAVKDVGPKVKIGPLETTVAPIGTVINAPVKMIDTYTVFFHEIGRQQSIWDDAMGLAQKEVPGRNMLHADFRDRFAHYLQNPTDDMEKAATAMGRRVSLRGRPQSGLTGRVSQGLRDVRDWEPVGSETPLLGKMFGGFAPGRRVIPFVNIAFNLGSIGTEYSPAGILRVLDRNLSAESKADALARAGLGTALMWHLGTKAASGELTGPLPTDTAERDEWRRVGKQPYSYKVGGDWVPFDRILGPMATPAKWVTGIVAAIQDAQGKPFDADVAAMTAAKIALAIGQGFTDTTFFIGPDQLLQAGQTAARGDVLGAATNYAGEQAASQMPFSGFTRSVAQSTDPFVRRVSGFKEQIEGVLPGFTENLPTSITNYGEANRRQEAEQGVSGVFNPIRATREAPRDPVDAELMQHQPFGTSHKTLLPTLIRASIAGDKLSAEEGHALQVLSGRTVHSQLSDLFTGKTKGRDEFGVEKAYGAMTEREKVANIERVINAAHHSARGVVADTILQNAKTEPEIQRAVVMRLSTISKVSDRADFLSGLQARGKLSDTLRAYLDVHRNQGERTVAQYLRIGRVR